MQLKNVAKNKMKLIKYKDRFHKRACPVCGCTHFVFINHYVDYPEEWNELICEHCGCTVEYVDNCFPQNIWDYIKEAGVRSKNKVIKEISSFYPSNEDIKKIL